MFAVSRLYRDKYAAFIGGAVKYEASKKAFRWLGLGVLSLRIIEETTELQPRFK